MYDDGAMRPGPINANRPAPKSVSGTPAFTGASLAFPVTDITPDSPWAIKSNPPFDDHGPVCPWPEIDA
jgi:hypothetical protein